MPSPSPHCGGTGYRAANRYVVFQCLKHTIDLPNEQWRVLDEAHRKRNLAEYEGDLDIAPTLVDALVRVAREVESRVGALGLRPRSECPCVEGPLDTSVELTGRE